MTSLQVFATIIGSIACVILMHVIINILEGNDIFDLIPESNIGWVVIIVGYLIWVIVFMFIFTLIYHFF